MIPEALIQTAGGDEGSPLAASGSSDEETLRQLRAAHDTSGRAYRSGEVDDPIARAIIAESDSRLRHHGHRCLNSRKVFGIPRLLEGTQAPWPLFPPRFRGMVGDSLIVVVGVYDSANLLPVVCYPEDPLAEFAERPVPIAESVDVEVALGLSGVRYSTFAYHRRFNPTLMAAVTKVAGISNFWTRPLLRWIESRSFGTSQPSRTR